MDDDGWTTVPRNKKLRPPKSTLPSQGQDRQVSVEKLLADYERYIRWWKTSECRRALRQTLDKVKPDEGWQIKEAIILGSGSFTRDNMECVKRSMLQITAFKDIVQHIQSTSTDDIKIIAQEPQYTSVDRRFLSELGIVVHDAEFNDSGRMWFNLQYGAMVFEAFMEMNLGDLEKLVQWDPKLYIGSSLQGRLDLLPHYMIDMDMRCVLNITILMSKMLILTLKLVLAAPTRKPHIQFKSP